MGIASIPSAGGGGIKSVQRGSAAGAGTVTITAVDINKSFVTVFGTASSGTVAASGSLSGGLNSTSMSGNASLNQSAGPQSNSHYGAHNASSAISGSISGNVNAANFTGANLSGGSNNLVAAVVQGYLSDSTSLVVSGACRWEVVEFN